MIAALELLWPAVEPVVTALFKALLPLIWGFINKPDTMEDSKINRDLAARLRQRLKDAGMLPVLLSVVCLSGCMGGNRVVYVKDGQPLRLAETVQAKVWVPDKNGEQVKSDNRVDLSEGGYYLTDPGTGK